MLFTRRRPNSQQVCCVYIPVFNMCRCVVCTKEEQEVTSSVGLYIHYITIHVYVYINTCVTHTHSSTMR